MRSVLEQEILKLKNEKDVLLLSHFYEDGEIQDIADCVADSLALAQRGTESPESKVLLAGVVFMAESVKILSPEKRVFVPDMNAGCSLVHESPYEKYKAWKDAHSNSVLITYVNSSALVKTVSDVICTSSNAEKIVNAIPTDKTILFGPDKNLGRWLAQKTGRKMVLWPGSCQVHVLFNAQKLMEIEEEHPDAVVIAHPECDDGILARATVIGSTSKLLSTVQEGKAKKYIVATEDGIFHQMKKMRPDVELIQAPTLEGCGCNQCPYMKLNTLEKIRDALISERPEITVPDDVVDRARLPLQRMMDISAGKSVSF